MATINAALNILVENANTFKERNQIYSLLESESNRASNTLITNLYKSAISKTHIDFDDIPRSKGDITKYTGFKSLMESIGYLKALADKSMIKIPDIETVDKAISNMTAYREHFEKGYSLGKEFIILQYNALVACCVEATSSLISSYVDFVRRIDTVEFTLVNTKTTAGGISVKNLELFNKSVANGDFSKIINTVIKTDNEGFTGTEVIVIPAIIIAGVATAIMSIRELIFYFYYSRMKFADYLKLQAVFLEMNKNNLKANSNISAQKKLEIMRNQEELSKKLRVMADKVNVDHVTTGTKIKAELKKENSGWTIGDIQSQSGQIDNNGFQLL